MKDILFLYCSLEVCEGYPIFYIVHWKCVRDPFFWYNSLEEGEGYPIF